MVDEQKLFGNVVGSVVLVGPDDPIESSAAATLMLAGRVGDRKRPVRFDLSFGPPRDPSARFIWSRFVSFHFKRSLSFKVHLEQTKQ